MSLLSSAAHGDTACHAACSYALARKARKAFGVSLASERGSLLGCMICAHASTSEVDGMPVQLGDAAPGGGRLPAQLAAQLEVAAGTPTARSAVSLPREWR